MFSSNNSRSNLRLHPPLQHPVQESLLKFTKPSIEWWGNLYPRLILISQLESKIVMKTIFCTFCPGGMATRVEWLQYICLSVFLIFWFWFVYADSTCQNLEQWGRGWRRLRPKATLRFLVQQRDPESKSNVSGMERPHWGLSLLPHKTFGRSATCWIPWPEKPQAM